MNHFLLSGLLTAITVFSLGFFVLCAKWPTRLAIIFFFYSLSIAIWSLSVFFHAPSLQGSSAFFWGRMLHIGAILIPVFFYHFVAILLSIDKKRRRIIILSYSIALLFEISLFTNGLVNGIEYRAAYSFPHPGPFYIFWFTFFVAMTIAGIFELSRRALSSTGREQKQILYVLFSSIIGYTGGLDNFLVTIDCNIFPLYPFGAYGIAFYVFVMTYAIMKHKLLDIEVIIKKTLVFSGLFASIYGVFTTASFLGREFFRDALGWNEWVALIPVVIFIILFHDPLQKMLIGITDKFLFQKKYNPLRVVHDFSQAVLTDLDLNKITKQTVEILSEALRVETCSIFIPNKEGSKFLLKESSGITDTDIFIADKSDLISTLNNSAVVTKATDEMKRIGAVICIGIMIRKNLIGVLALGKKKSDEEYTKDDIGVLNILTDALGVAITNALAYEELRHKANLVTIGTLAAGIRHDISKPIDRMNADVSGFLVRLKRNDYRDPTQMLNESGELLERCGDTFQTVIGISEKYAARPKESEKRVILDVSEAVDGALSVVEHRINKSGVKIVKEIPDNLPKISFDKDYMRQILDNLFTNAVDAIDAAKRSTDESIITIKARQVENRTLNVCLEISDTGTGIPEKIRDKIFKSWFTTKGEKGTGLGLALVSELVMRGGGTVDVQSEEGKGTTFILGLKGIHS